MAMHTMRVDWHTPAAARLAPRRGRVQCVAVITASLVALAVEAVVVWVAPWLGFAGAVGAALVWCAWLDHHPESIDQGAWKRDDRGRSARVRERVIPYRRRTDNRPTVR
jgi:hypothetical protein